MISWIERIIFQEIIWNFHQTVIGFEILTRLYTSYDPLAISLNKQIFQFFVRKGVSKQEQDKLIKNNLGICIDPRIAEIFETFPEWVRYVSSLILNFVSCSKSHHLHRKAILRDKKEQKEAKYNDLKDAAELIPKLLIKIKSLRQVIA